MDGRGRVWVGGKLREGRVCRGREELGGGKKCVKDRKGQRKRAATVAGVMGRGGEESFKNDAERGENRGGG